MAKRVHKSFGGVMRELVWHFAELFYHKRIGGCCKAWSVAADLVCKREAMTVPGDMAVQDFDNTSAHRGRFVVPPPDRQNKIP